MKSTDDTHRRGMWAMWICVAVRAHRVDLPLAMSSKEERAERPAERQRELTADRRSTS